MSAAGMSRITHMQERVLKKCCIQQAGKIQGIIKRSVAEGIVPLHWKKADMETSVGEMMTH